MTEQTATGESERLKWRQDRRSGHWKRKEEKSRKPSQNVPRGVGGVPVTWQTAWSCGAAVAAGLAWPGGTRLEVRICRG